MLITPTVDKLHALGLSAMAHALTEQQASSNYTELAFEDRLGLLVDHETQVRANRRLERNLRTAKLRASACVEDIDFRAPRGIDRSVVLTLASSHWVTAHQNLLIVGPTGAGKTFLACALAHAAVRAGHTALYLRAPRLLDELAVSHGDGRFARLMAAWTRVDVLLIDDLALRPLTTDQAGDLLEVIEDRNQRRSTIVTSQLPVANWHEALGDPTLADAILDRLAHNAHRLELRGDSLRREPSATASPQPDVSAGVGRARKRAAESPSETR